ncbi:YlaF family protein [Neobacillus thermocopriae]|uniref:YlaF family protein n=1 Tax=Neobacillus thermocopriae TaxID=1215031 RepID=A0A6B3TMR5_9BACI|nr:YlaF family protein [Neobacillus thermocopriae]MED3624375.1 YlaF family protein [Neobacillus thermocopriae]MED3713430.1 YlaF family protein [Neobacillus thermocopriae]NEX77540.1 YlaF family protein [Neobacillus thermocopriae]
MSKVKWPLLVYAILVTVCIMGIGVAIAEKSLIGVIISIVVGIIVMGLGFKTKKRLREEGKL